MPQSDLSDRSWLGATKYGTSRYTRECGKCKQTIHTGEGPILYHNRLGIAHVRCPRESYSNVRLIEERKSRQSEEEFPTLVHYEGANSPEPWRLWHQRIAHRKKQGFDMREEMLPEWPTTKEMVGTDGSGHQVNLKMIALELDPFASDEKGESVFKEKGEEDFSVDASNVRSNRDFSGEEGAPSHFSMREHPVEDGNYAVEGKLFGPGLLLALRTQTKNDPWMPGEQIIYTVVSNKWVHVGILKSNGSVVLWNRWRDTILGLAVISAVGVVIGYPEQCRDAFGVLVQVTKNE